MKRSTFAVIGLLFCTFMSGCDATNAKPETVATLIVLVFAVALLGFFVWRTPQSTLEKLEKENSMGVLEERELNKSAEGKDDLSTTKNGSKLVDGRTYQLGFIPFVLNLFWFFGIGHFLTGNFKWGFLSFFAPLGCWLVYGILLQAITQAGAFELIGILGLILAIVLIIFYIKSLTVSYDNCKRLMQERNAFILNGK